MNNDAILYLDNFALSSKHSLSINWFRIAIHADPSFFIGIVVFDLKVLWSIHRSIKFHQSKTHTSQCIMSFCLDIGIIYAVLSNSNRSFCGIEGCWIEVEIFEETLILLAV